MFCGMTLLMELLGDGRKIMLDHCRDKLDKLLFKSFAFVCFIDKLVS